ncbi:MAG: ABC transporter ATP-binding protein [Lachnospirales bacterium]
MSKLVLKVENLQKKYPIYGTFGKLMPPKTNMLAVSDLSFDLYEGETYGLVGESGCGKSTTGRCILGLVNSDGGEINYKNQNLCNLKEKDFRPLRKDIQLVFQDTLSSLSPKQRIGEILEEPLIIQKIGTQSSRKDSVLDMLNKVGLPSEYYFRYPHELSGGQVQRLGIAKALIINPKLIVCDEPVSALDVSIQAQVLNMLISLQKEMNLSLLFISHDIGVVKHISHRIGVMYLGTLVEEATSEELFNNPKHPYTRALLNAVPKIGVKKENSSIVGEQPTRTDEFVGCVFNTRCPYATDMCRESMPTYRYVNEQHKVACHFDTI